MSNLKQMIMKVNTQSVNFNADKKLIDFIQAIRKTEKIISGSGVKEPSLSEMKNKEIARKSIHLKNTTQKGQTISFHDLENVDDFIIKIKTKYHRLLLPEKDIIRNIQKKLINKDAIYESLVAFKRAGANAIVSYYADRIDKIIK